MNTNYDPNTADFFTLTKNLYIRSWTSWNSRCTRREFWLGGLCWLWVILPFFLFDILFLDWTAALMNPHNPFAGYTLLNWILFVFFLILNWIPGIGAMVRRLHDIGKSGWYCAPFVVMSIVHGFNYQWIDLLCLPIYIISFSCFCRDSVACSNAWGASPKYREN